MQPQDEQAIKRFGSLPAEHLFGDVGTVIELLWLVRAISNDAPSADAAMRLLWLLSANFHALKLRIQQTGELAPLRRQLRALEDRARKLRAELEDAAVLSKLIATARAEQGSCSREDVIAWQRTVDDLAHLAEAAAKGLPSGKGRTRDYAAGYSAQELCAFTIRNLWHEAHGEWPSSQDQNAWEACTKLWNAAGGKRDRHPSKTPARQRQGEPQWRWRRHLEKVAVTPPPLAPIGTALMKGEDGRVAIAEHLGSDPERST